MSIQYTKGQEFITLARYNATSPDALTAFVRIRDAKDDHCVTDRLRELAIDAVGPANEPEIHTKLRLQRNFERLDKASVPPGATTNPDYEALLSVNSIATEWISNLVGYSVPDTLIPLGARRVKVNTKFGVSGALPTAATGPVGEGRYKPVRSFHYTVDTIGELKSAVNVPFSDELLKFSPVEAQNMFDADLRALLAMEMNKYVLAELASGAPQVPSTGASATAIHNDFINLFGELTRRPQSKFLFVVSVENSDGLVHSNVGGLTAFPNMGPNGGEALGVQVLPVGADELAPGTGVLIAADGIAVDPGTMAQRRHRGDIVMETDPSSSPPEHELVSQFQNNLTSILAERWFGIAAVRAGSVAVLTDMDWNGIST